MGTWNLSPTEYAATRDKIAALNSRKAKKGFTGRVEFTGVLSERKVQVSAGISVNEKYYACELTGEPAHYDGYSFVAVAQWDEYAGLIVRTSPGVESIDRDKLRENYCEHCHVTRARNKTYILRGEYGGQIQVGSKCISDFLPSHISPVFISDDEIERSIVSGIGSKLPAYDVADVLAIAYAVIKTNGWVSVKNAPLLDKVPTKEIVAFVIEPYGRIEPREQAWIDGINALAASEDIRAKGVEVREWILSDEFTGDSEYVHNLKALCAAEYVTTRNFGFIVSAPAAMMRATTERVEKVAKPVSNWVGEVKGKVIDVPVTLESTRYISGYYGTTVLYKFRDGDGNVYAWFSSRDLDLEDGKQFKLSGTVKAHEEYAGEKQTTVTRCKIV